MMMKDVGSRNKKGKDNKKNGNGNSKKNVGERKQKGNLLQNLTGGGAVAMPRVDLKDKYENGKKGDSKKHS